MVYSSCLKYLVPMFLGRPDCHWSFALGLTNAMTGPDCCVLAMKLSMITTFLLHPHGSCCCFNHGISAFCYNVKSMFFIMFEFYNSSPIVIFFKFRATFSSYCNTKSWLKSMVMPPKLAAPGTTTGRLFVPLYTPLVDGLPSGGYKSVNCHVYRHDVSDGFGMGLNGV